MTVYSKNMACSHTKPSHLHDFDEENTIDNLSVHRWEIEDVLSWASNVERCTSGVTECLRKEGIDGEVLMALTEEDIRDFRYKLNYSLTFSELKKLWLSVRALQLRHGPFAKAMGFTVEDSSYGPSRLSPPLLPDSSPLHQLRFAPRASHSRYGFGTDMNGMYAESFPIRSVVGTTRMSINAADYESATTLSMPVDGRGTNIPPEFFKTAISLGYSFLVTWITSFVMVIVHERVPDMKRYPPLPDIFLDNVPHIPWAFHMCEITGTLLFSIWSCVCVFHRYRMVLLRRFFALAGTVFLLRCVTMLITSLSVPGTHLQCNQNDYAVDDTELTVNEALHLRISRAYTIWSGLGMSIQGVRTCGDYMFSGHTVALTLLNFFITEYTPRNLYFLHTLTWLLNMFGIFFILAAHEHYSIDVFVAFYITSRLFLYYHTLANNQALMSRDSNRTRIWFPMFSYFESSVNGIIPNEFDTFGTLLNNLWNSILGIKDSCILTARRIWLDHPDMAKFSETSRCASPDVDDNHRDVKTLASARADIMLSSSSSSSSEYSNNTANIVTCNATDSGIESKCSVFSNNIQVIKAPQTRTIVKKIV